MTQMMKLPATLFTPFPVSLGVAGLNFHVLIVVMTLIGTSWRPRQRTLASTVVDSGQTYCGRRARAALEHNGADSSNVQSLFRLVGLWSAVTCFPLSRCVSPCPPLPPRVIPIVYPAHHSPMELTRAPKASECGFCLFFVWEFFVGGFYNS